MIPADLDAIGAAVVSWLLTYAIHSTILLSGAAVVAWRFAEQYAWHDLMWKGALVGSLVTASLHVSPVSMPFAGRWSLPTVTTVPGIPEPELVTTDAVNGPAIRTEQPIAAASTEQSPKRRSSLAPPAANAIVMPSRLRRWPLIAAVTWLGIAGVGLVRYLLRLRRVHRVLGSGSPVSIVDLLAIVDTLRRHADQRRSIALATSPGCPVPLALAGGRIVLPGRFLTDLDADQQRAALAHEVAHVARRDPEWRIAMEMLECALFFQPLIRLARARLCESAEFLCDHWAVQQTQSPLALANCLSVIASWWTPDEALPAGVSAMARSDSAMVRRVTRILDEPRLGRRPRAFWLAVPVVLVAVSAPRVTATALPASIAVEPAAGALPAGSNPPAAVRAAEQDRSPRQWTAAEIAAARAQLRVQRPARAGGTLQDRWSQAIADAARQGLSDFWVVYMFDTPVHAGDMIMGDTRDGSFVSSNGRITSSGAPLASLFEDVVSLEAGNLAVLVHYRAPRADAIDRAGYRSANLGFQFGRTPVFWLGHAVEAQSFARVRDLFGQVKGEKLQIMMIELASMHADSNVVIPFLEGLLDPSRPAAIRAEAAEGFDHHHDPRSVAILLRVARNDSDTGVRAEAAETIGEVQTPQSVPALQQLVDSSTDPAVRREAAEAFAEQPPASVVPAIERIIANNDEDEVLGEVIEALGELDDPRVLQLLVQTVNTHRNPRAQQEAVETLGDIDDPAVVDALTRIVWEHELVAIQREAVETLGDRRDDAVAKAAVERIVREHQRDEVVSEAIETLADMSGEALHPEILALAASGRTPGLRREAIDAIADAVEKAGDARSLDLATGALEKAIFDDPDQSVQLDAIDALDKLPAERALRLLREVVDRHANARVRREASEQIRERQ